MALSHQVLSVTRGNLINLAAVEKTKQTNIIEFKFSTGMSRSEKKNKMEKIVLFFFNFQKVGSVGSVKRKIKNDGLMV